MISFRGLITATLLGILATFAAAQNPIPQVVGPPSPQAVKPGGKDFTLKVYGANFVPGSVVNWNRQARTTRYVSGHEVDATILATDIVANTAGYITVTNPPPGGGVSSASWTLVEVHDPTPGISATELKPFFYKSGGVVTQLLYADFNNDGIMDLADTNAADRIPILLGDGLGNFSFSHMATWDYWANPGLDVAYGDFNSDGNLDLAYQANFGPNNPTGLAVSLGNGDGSFKPGWRKDDGTVVGVLVGDFNQDGKLDLIVGNCCITKVFLGNGDGTFTLLKTYNFGGLMRLAGDFNGDGKLDLIAVTDAAPSSILVALGNGDGTFQRPRKITTFNAAGGGLCAFSPSMLVNDFNGDGNLDIAYCEEDNIGILLGKGDGTFQKPLYYYVDSQAGEFSFTAGDFNSDGKADLIVSHLGTLFNNPAFIMPGNGDGTFQPKQFIPLKPKGSNGEAGIITGDFNSDGLLDFMFQEGGYGFAEYLQVQP